MLFTMIDFIFIIYYLLDASPIGNQIDTWIVDLT